MEKRRRVWRTGIAPQLSVSALLSLQSALRRDDQRLLQGVVTAPPLEANAGCAVVGACAIGLCGWLGEGLSSVAAVEEYFNGICEAADRALAGEPAACRFFFNWFDDAPRLQMRREMLAEVARALESRTAIAA